MVPTRAVHFVKTILTTPLAPRKVGLVVFVTIFVSIVIEVTLAMFPIEKFHLLAGSFLDGSLAFPSLPGSGPNGWWPDTAPFQGQSYLPFGPLPAVLLMPLVLVERWLGFMVGSAYVHLAVAGIAVLLVFLVARRRIGFSVTDSVYAAFAFGGASMFLGVVILPWDVYLSHLIAVLFLWAAIAEYLGKRRWWIVGACMAFAFATRATAGIGILFFVGHLMFLERGRWRETVRALGALIIPLVLAAGALAFYNFLRFGTTTETGYTFQYLYYEVLRQARDYGIFSIVHIPGNLFHAFVAGPLPVFRDALSHVLSFPYLKADLWGMSIFLTSPYLLTLFAKQTWDTTAKLLLATCALIALPLFLYYGVGYVQLGYRYALDFMPFLFLLFLTHYRSRRTAFSPGMRSLILCSAMVNLYLFIAPMVRA